jgi:hypothetical protein
MYSCLTDPRALRSTGPISPAVWCRWSLGIPLANRIADKRKRRDGSCRSRPVTTSSRTASRRSSRLPLGRPSRRSRPSRRHPRRRHPRRRQGTRSCRAPSPRTRPHRAPTLRCSPPHARRSSPSPRSCHHSARSREGRAIDHEVGVSPFGGAGVPLMRGQCRPHEGSMIGSPVRRPDLLRDMRREPRGAHLPHHPRHRPS